jgi:hypothetical protein
MDRGTVYLFVLTVQGKGQGRKNKGARCPRAYEKNSIASLLREIEVAHVQKSTLRD